MNVLALIVLALGFSLAVNLFLKKYEISSIVGYIFTGFIIATFIDYAHIDQHILAELAEFGIVFLMFTIGLEFSLPHMTVIILRYSPFLRKSLMKTASITF